MIRSDRLLYDIAPEGFGERHCESWDTWRVRAHTMLPQFPDEVLEQWLYRHWKGVLCNWGWLDFNAMSFTKQSWSSDKVLSEICTPHDDVIDKLSRRMSNPIFQRSWLVQNMQDTGTWPVAPIVLEYERDLYATNGRVLKAPFNLLEGHHRFAYLKNLSENNEFIQDKHEIWVAKIPVH
ncbi:hypothetical protein L4D00_07365 [Photobacterium swingsii]|uniref:Uncharacterized protein n=1 Tax=Photobacterium swingsii TaxID=680026 RepID=A0A0J8VEY1_9GAMM|nr:hypothetical protein [Photobacterium swingsii]KMV32008.1 hypothetical protein AB733_00065 [Photobacterium swingsii]PSW26775.1 hypothetical protein C9I94_01980 [Photobacterium swingsii]